MSATFDLGTIDITPKLQDDVKIINSYSDSYFVVSGEKFEHDIIITEKKCFLYEGMKDIEKILSSSDNILILFGSNEEKNRSEFLALIQKSSNNLLTNIFFEAMTM